MSKQSGLEIFERAVLARGRFLRSEADQTGPTPGILVLTLDVGRIAIRPGDGCLLVEHVADAEMLPAGLQAVDDEDPWWRLLGQPITAAWSGGVEEGVGARGLGSLMVLKLRFREESDNPRIVRLETAGRAVRVSLEGPWPEPGSAGSEDGGIEMGNEERVTRSDEQWREQLSDEEYQVARCSATEAAFSGRYWDEKALGTYHCICCDAALFRSEAKYDSGTGWPSFFEPIDGTAVTEKIDQAHGMVRTESRCASCDAHLGHVFPDGPPPTGLRYCMNSASLRLEKDEA